MALASMVYVGTASTLTFARDINLIVVGIMYDEGLPSILVLVMTK